jgi:superfamily I DNA/RNA helicase
MLRRVAEAGTRVNPSEICFLSFTKAGAAEALKRLNISRSDKICTIHSLMFRLNGMTSAGVVDSAKLRKFGDKAGFRFRGQSNDTGEQMEIGDQYLAILSRAVNRMVDLWDEYHESDRPGDWEGFRFFCESYNAWKQSNGYCDFNDMLSFYVKSRHNSHTPKMSVVFVDEAQDLSNLQWEAIRTLITQSGASEIHIAGDDDQAIYEWSGASTHGMLAFEEEFNAIRTVLTQSWRVPIAVHGMAMKVVQRIGSRVEKIYSPKPEPGLVVRSSYFNPKNIAPGRDTLVLCRNYITRKEIEDELIRHRIPYVNEGGLPGLFGTRLADGIRAFNKMQRGEPVSPSELEKIALVANERTKHEVQTRNFKPMLERGFMRSLVIPPQLVDFYRDADLTGEPHIRLSTIHSAKGREADHVIIHPGLTQKTLVDMENNPDSEARVWYVAVTRAKHTLEILEGDNAYGL